MEEMAGRGSGRRLCEGLCLGVEGEAHQRRWQGGRRGRQWQAVAGEIDEVAVKRSVRGKHAGERR